MSSGIMAICFSLDALTSNSLGFGPKPWNIDLFSISAKEESESTSVNLFKMGTWQWAEIWVLIIGK
jgi:hypothetical protein